MEGSRDQGRAALNRGQGHGLQERSAGLEKSLFQRIDLRPERRHALRAPSSLFLRLGKMREICRRMNGEAEDAIDVGKVAELLRKRRLTACHADKERFCYSAASSLHHMLASVTRASTELFAGAINVTGAFPQRFSEFEDDIERGSLGKWAPEGDRAVKGAIASSMLSDNEIERMISAFNASALLEASCCRVALLPRAKAGCVRRLAQRRSLLRNIILLLPPDERGLRPCSDQLAREEKKRHHPHRSLHIVVALWVNESRKKEFSAAINAESCVDSWIGEAWARPRRAQLFRKRLQRLFPPHLRSSKTLRALGVAAATGD
eukprot:Plantae.Rhodophyta-Hildenbrandia_rubra.ctg10359.p2 GENE.Plantae.Rhodophyta-Hildenbrandia_rubra.ctg10359~~Plantae.Rhodophyta-Hildenbrandia_rubra.ctg10359.p2  ORF type:complete len:320 (+),score=42.12 Plantae.Rhodophyta-Hildenbrandia_rubra.ctg10359:3-962(+)